MTTSDLVLRPGDVALEVSLPSDRSPAVGLSSRSRGGSGDDKPAVRRQATVEHAAPPEMADSYPRDFHSPKAPMGRVAEPAGSGVPDPGTASVDAGASAPAPRLHRVVDGDTLRDLARKYLGGADRYLELYEANRRVLTSPDLLPIGVEITIPPSAPPAGAQQAHPSSSAHPPSKARDAVSEPLPGDSLLTPVPPGALHRSAGDHDGAGQ